MGTCLLVVLPWLGMLCSIGIYTAPAHTTVHFDPLRPSTVLPVMERGVRILVAQVRGVGQGITDAFANLKDERAKRHVPLNGVEE